MKTKTPLSWLNNLDTIYKEELISWFNTKMDELMIQDNLIQFNNPKNSLVDIINYITPKIEIFVAPDNNSTPKEIEYFVSLTENKSDIGELTYNYCLTKFDQTA